MPSTATEIARFSDRGESHSLRKPWSYTRHSDNVTTCGKREPRMVERLASGNELPVTCKNCRRNLQITA
jgi:hypothetical protein